MSEGLFGSLPSFAAGDVPDLSPDLLAYLRGQAPGADGMVGGPQQVQQPVVPQATSPGFTGFAPQTPPTGAPTPVVQPGAAAFAGTAMNALGPSNAQAAETPRQQGGSYAERIGIAESNGISDAKNPRSSATGVGQFIDSTWLDQVRKNRPDLAGLPDGQILSMRSDPVLSRQMIDAYGAENGAKLRAAGLPDTDATRSLAHFAGAAGAKATLSVDPSTPIAQVLQPSQISANPFLRNWTAGRLVDWAAQRIGGGAPTQQTPAFGDPTAAAMGSTAQAGGFGLGGVVGLGAPVPGQSSPMPGVASLAGQPLALGGAPAAQQPASPYAAIGDALKSLAGGQQQQRQGQGQRQGGGFPAIEGGGRAISLQQARSMFDPGKFYQALRASGINTSGR